MKGSPCWGKNTYQDILKIDLNRAINLSLDTFNTLLIKNNIDDIEVKDIYTLFLALHRLNMLFVIKDKDTLDSERSELFLSWCSDISFNYRDRKIVIPYYSFSRVECNTKFDYSETDYIDSIGKNKISLKYAFKLNLLTVDDRETGERLDNLYVYDYESKLVYLINLSGLPYLSSETFSMEDLYNRYINSAYIVSDLVMEKEKWKYYSIENPKGRYINIEHKQRSNRGLPHYFDKYNVNYKYRDVRHYNFEELMGYFLVDDESDFSLRLYLFEAYLYCIFAQKLEVLEDDYKTGFNALFESNSYRKRFLKVSYHDKGRYPLILKDYYCDRVNYGHRRKTYERYK